MPKSGLNPTADQDHISEDAVLGFLAGQIAGQELFEIERHLSACGTCRRVLAVAGAHLRSLGAQDWSEASALSGETEASVLLRALRTVDETDYVVERELARGGMGRILLATDRQARAVAIKVLLESSERGLRRFLREMQITARLQHPSIITLYEAGRWPSGEPFFAMKLVQGRTLREELAERTALNDRLALLPRLISVTDALAYAHAQGIIHRDLKPGNILVGAFGETVVIDWGLAKLCGSSADASEPSGTVEPPSHSYDTTQYGTPIGTPAYMAPEQARAEALDERADVYGLGALLYHVLSGRPPYAGWSARDVLAQVDVGPPPPLAKLMPGLPTDLVAIVTKAMMPAPGDRYPSAQSMAEDLRRFSAGQLVSAHVYTARALVRRWAHRNRAVVSVAAGLLTLGMIAGSVSINRIIEARNRTEVERANATAHHAAAENLVKFLITEFRDRVVRADRLDLVDGLGNQVFQYYRNIDGSGIPVDPTTSSNRAMTLQVLAGLELDRRNLAEARVLFQRALAFWQSADRGLDLPASELAKYGEAWQNYASIEDLDAHVDAALAAYQKAVDLADRIAAHDRGDLEGHLLAASSLGWICETLRSSKGDLLGSVRACSAGIARLEPLLLQHPNDAKLLRRLAFLNELASDRQLALGHLDEAGACIKRSAELYSRVLKADPRDARAAREYAYTFIYLGTVELASGSFGAALAAIDVTVQRYEDIVEQDRGNLANEDDLGVGYVYKCDFERRSLNLDAAGVACRKAVALFREHVALGRASPSAQGLLVLALTSLGRVELAARRLTSSAQALSEAVAGSRALLEADATSDSSKEALRSSLVALAEAELALERLDEARHHSREALALAEELARAVPESTESQSALGRVQTVVGDVALAEARPRDAASSYEDARRTFEKLRERSPRVVDFQTGLARSCHRRADALEAVEGAQSPAVRQLREAARGIVEDLTEQGRLAPEDAALAATGDTREPRTQRRAAAAAGK
jgi:tetratricopeptide (TPR) repeat protein